MKSTHNTSHYAYTTAIVISKPAPNSTSFNISQIYTRKSQTWSPDPIFTFTMDSSKYLQKRTPENPSQTNFKNSPVPKAPIERIKKNYKNANKVQDNLTKTPTPTPTVLSERNQMAGPQKIVGFTVSEEALKQWKEEHQHNLDKIPSLLEGIQERIDYMKYNEHRYKSWYCNSYK